MDGTFFAASKKARVSHPWRDPVTLDDDELNIRRAARFFLASCQTSLGGGREVVVGKEEEKDPHLISRRSWPFL